MIEKRLYSIWHNMKKRCYYAKSKSFKNYGARGITVCDEWKNDYRAFEKWAMENGYRYNLTIDRINVNGNYEPSNCRLATREQQDCNTRRNVNITYKGETKTVAQWSRVYKIDHCLLGIRLRRGWSFERAVATPPRKYSHVRGVN